MSGQQGWGWRVTGHRLAYYHGVLLAYGWCTGHVLILYGWCTDIVRLVYAWCTSRPASQAIATLKPLQSHLPRFGGRAPQFPPAPLSFPFFSFRCREKRLLSRLDTMKKTMANLWWLLVAVAGAGAYATLAFHRGEALNSAFILVAALCSYAIGYRF